LSSRFLQVHTLTSYPAALLNRDDAGFAKRIPFGGETRTRISSQCLKRHWRAFEGDNSLASISLDGAPEPMSIRSRRTFERYVFEPLIADGVDAALAEGVTVALMDAFLGESAKKKAERAAQEGAAGKGRKAKKNEAPEGEAADTDSPGAEPEPAVRTNQVTVLGRPEIDYILAEAREIARSIEKPADAKSAVAARVKAQTKNVESLKRACGLDAAVFGRMVTSDILARTDAAIHVAHAFTTHAESSETDYFSALDELIVAEGGRELGSGHINTSELTSGLYYSYVVVDVPLLVSNLEGVPRSDWTAADRSLAAEVVRRLVHLVATVSPGAKRGATAPYSYAHMVLAESGSAQPCSLANAFLTPVEEFPDVVRGSYEALAKHLGEIDAMFARSNARRCAARGPVDTLGDVASAEARLTLPDLAVWAADQVRGS
jgi:CRISPR system Cascade subunit CasC